MQMMPQDVWLCCYNDSMRLSGTWLKWKKANTKLSPVDTRGKGLLSDYSSERELWSAVAWVATFRPLRLPPPTLHIHMLFYKAVSGCGLILCLQLAVHCNVVTLVLQCSMWQKISQPLLQDLHHDRCSRQSEETPFSKVKVSSLICVLPARLGWSIWKWNNIPELDLWVWKSIRQSITLKKTRAAQICCTVPSRLNAACLIAQQHFQRLFLSSSCTETFLEPA